MAKVVGVDTQIRGKLGARIYQVLNGEQIVKTFAIPSNPESSGQVAQRGVFRDIIACFKSIASEVIAYFWDPFTTTNKTGWGNFISANLLSMGKVAFDITDGVLSQGSLEPVQTLSAEYTTATGVCAVTFSEDKTINGSADDEMSFVVVDADSGLVVGKVLNEDTRADSPLDVACVKDLTATNLEVFAICSQAGFVATGEGLVSNSANCTATAPV